MSENNFITCIVAIVAIVAITSLITLAVDNKGVSRFSQSLNVQTDVSGQAFAPSKGNNEVIPVYSNGPIPRTTQPLDVISPTVGSYSPQTGSILVTNEDINFTCNVSDNIGLRKVVFWLATPTKGLSVNETRYVTGNSTRVTFTKQFMKLGNYAWNCQVYDTSNNHNWTFTQSSTSPGFTITPSYNFLAEWGSGNRSPNAWYTYTALSPNSKYIYVSHIRADRIEQFTTNGVFVRQWGSRGNGSGQFVLPNHIAVDTLGNVYVVDEGNLRVQKFSGNGTFMTMWGSAGNGPGQIGRPGSGDRGIITIATDRLNNVYLTDGVNNRAEKFSSDGEFLGEWALSDYAVGISTDSKNDVYTLNLDGVTHFDSNGVLLNQWNISHPSNSQLKSLFVDSTGKIFISVNYYFDNRVNTPDDEFDGFYIYTNNGTFIKHVYMFDALGGALWGSTPTGISIDKDGNVYLSDARIQRIQKYVPVGS